MPSGAPLVISSRSRLTVSDHDGERRRSKSKGISSHLRIRSRVGARQVEDRFVERASDAGFELAVEIGQVAARVPIGCAQRIDCGRASFPGRSAFRFCRCTGCRCCRSSEWPKVLDDDLLARHVDGALASVTDVIIGRNSGVRPTARATANRRDSNVSRCRTTLTGIRKMTRKSTVRARSWLKSLNPRSKAVSSGRAARRTAMSPKAVRAPVLMTSAVAEPLTTDVPRNTM